MNDPLPPPLAGLERATYARATSDGTLDLLLAALLLALGVTAATEVDFVPLLVLLAVPWVWRGTRRRLVEPRLGYVRLRSERVARTCRNKRVIGAAMFLTALVLIVLDVTLSGDDGRLLPEPWRPVAMGLFLGLPLIASGLLFELPRLYAYGGVMLVAAGGAGLAGAPAATPIFAAALAASVGGVILLARFLRAHPLDREAEAPRGG